MHPAVDHHVGVVLRHPEIAHVTPHIASHVWHHVGTHVGNHAWNNVRVDVEWHVLTWRHHWHLSIEHWIGRMIAHEGQVIWSHLNVLTMGLLLLHLYVRPFLFVRHEYGHVGLLIQEQCFYFWLLVICGKGHLEIISKLSQNY